MATKLKPIEELCSEILPYDEIYRRYSRAVDDVAEKIRSSGSLLRSDDLSTFVWGVSMSQTTPYIKRGRARYYNKPSLRVVAEKGRLRRISGLYDLEGKIVSGNFTF